MASISLPIAMLIGGGLSAAGSVASGVLGSNAATTAAGEQATAEQNALGFQENVFNQEQANQAPFIQAGQTSIANLMSELSSGKFGPGSLGTVPTAPAAFTGTFAAPTLSEAEQTPGYQFTAEQGSKGILEGAAAAGGAISGGTLRALDSYNSGLANSTYNDVFNRALQTYQTGLQSYNANLQGYGAQLQGFATNAQAQQQEFNQAVLPAEIGQGAIQNVNNIGQQTAVNAGNLMGQIGNAQAAGTVGSTNALTGGLSGGLNSIGSSLSLSQLLPYLLSRSGGVPAGTGPG